MKMFPNDQFISILNTVGIGSEHWNSVYGEIAILAVSRRFLSVSERETQNVGMVEN
jgi:hypothetical protein